MKIIKPSYEILGDPDWNAMIKHIELCGRVCYKSEEKIKEESAIEFVEKIIKRGHEAVLEHASFSVRFICDRGVSHEMVRHRLCSFCQESTRYCNYGDGEIQFILPPWMSAEYASTNNVWDMDRLIKAAGTNDTIKECSIEQAWVHACLIAETTYKIMVNGNEHDEKWVAQQARSVLPNSLKTEIIVTANIRQWRKMFELRCASAAHPQMRELMIPLFHDVQSKAPRLFSGVNFK